MKITAQRVYMLQLLLASAVSSSSSSSSSHMFSNDTLGTSDEEEWVTFQFKWGMAHFVGTTLILTFLTLLTVIGNVFVVAAILLDKTLQNVANYLILSLAVADLMVAILVMPLSAIHEVSKSWWMGIELCDMWVILDVLCCSASILHLVAIATDRYYAVTNIKYHRSSKRIFSMIAVVWLMAIVISIPSRFHWHRSDEERDRVLRSGMCHINLDHGYTLFSTLLSFYLPMLFLILVYGRIYFAARSRIRRKHFPSQLSSVAQDYESMTCVVLDTEDTDVSQSRSSTRRWQSHLVWFSLRHVASPLLPGGGGGGSGGGGGNGRPRSHPAAAGSANACKLMIVNSQTESSQWTEGGSSSHLEGPLNESKLSQSESDQWKFADEEEVTEVCVHATQLRSTEVVVRYNAVNVPTDDVIRNPTVTTTKPMVMCQSSELVRPIHSTAHCFDGRRARQATLQRSRLMQQRERRAARTLSIITGCFFICWFPFFVDALLNPFCSPSGCKTPEFLKSIFLWLGYMNSLCNPIIYTTFAPDFRQAFRKILYGRYSRMPWGPQML